MLGNPKGTFTRVLHVGMTPMNWHSIRREQFPNAKRASLMINWTRRTFDDVYRACDEMRPSSWVAPILETLFADRLTGPMIIWLSARLPAVEKVHVQRMGSDCWHVVEALLSTCWNKVIIFGLVWLPVDGGLEWLDWLSQVNRIVTTFRAARERRMETLKLGVVAPGGRPRDADCRTFLGRTSPTRQCQIGTIVFVVAGTLSGEELACIEVVLGKMGWAECLSCTFK